MPNQFHKHYTREQARELLPDIRRWLKQLRDLRKQIHEQDATLAKLMQPGCDIGGTPANNWVRTMTAMQEVLFEFYSREVLIKDLDRGLIDFPALRDGKEVFLCWEHGEPDVAFWHDLESGYAGRQPLEE